MTRLIAGGVAFAQKGQSDDGSADVSTASHPVVLAGRPPNERAPITSGAGRNLNHGR
jgi:hypothetical protein